MLCVIRQIKISSSGKQPLHEFILAKFTKETLLQKLKDFLIKCVVLLPLIKINDSHCRRGLQFVSIRKWNERVTTKDRHNRPPAVGVVVPKLITRSAILVWCTT